jgi:hypothetical protein
MLAPMNRDKRQQIFERLRSANPKPRTELNFSSPFELLIAVILSAQATDKGVNKATARLFPVANTAAAMAGLGEEGLKSYIKTIGLFNSKAANIIKTCRILDQDYNGEVPQDRPSLEALPGVGRKTANVVLNTAFGYAYFPGLQPNPHRAGKDPAGGRETPAAAGAEGISAGRPSLVDPARQVCLRGAQTEMPGLSDK